MKRFTALLTGVIAALMLCGINAFAEMSISAKAYVLMDAMTGRIIVSSNENTRLPMASTTKIMTTLLMLESGELDESFCIDDAAVLTEGSSMGLSCGDIVTKRQLCYGMMLPSGNDAANASALKLAGSYDGFARMMNARANEIGMKNTNFVTPSGLHDKNHYSSAYDMALLTREALNNSDFRDICSTDYMRIDCGETGKSYYLSNSNKLLSRYKYCIGVKTGFTDEAGRCLVSAAQMDGVTLICVTLNDRDDWNDHEKLYNAGFGTVEIKKLDRFDKTTKVDVVGGEYGKIDVIPEKIPVCTEINGVMPEITVEYNIPDFVYAPVSTGDTIGTMKCFADGILLDNIPLKANTDCAYRQIATKKSIYRIIIDFLKQFFKEK